MEFTDPTTTYDSPWWIPAGAESGTEIGEVTPNVEGLMVAQKYVPQATATFIEFLEAYSKGFALGVELSRPFSAVVVCDPGRGYFGFNAYPN